MCSIRSLILRTTLQGIFIFLLPLSVSIFESKPSRFETFRFEEDFNRRLPGRQNRYPLPEGLLEDVREFFLQRGSTSLNVDLAQQVLRATYAEMLLFSMEYDDTRLFNKLIRYATPVRLNVHLEGFDVGTLLTYICSERGATHRFKYLPALVESGADITLPSQDGSTPFLVAVESGNTLAIDYIISHFLQSNETKALLVPYLSARNANGTTAIYASLKKRDFRTVHLLLDLGVDPNTLAPTRNEFLITAAIKQGSMDLIRHLIAVGANVRALDRKQMDAMSLSMKNYRPEAQREILLKLQGTFNEFKALPKHERQRSQPFDSITRLHSAMKDGVKEEFVLALLEMELEGDNIEICTSTDPSGRTLFHAAIYFDYPKVLTRLLKFYIELQRNNPEGTELCSADFPDRFGYYPSESIMQDPKWRTLPEFDMLIDFLYSLHPRTKSNSLQEVLRKPLRIGMVFLNANQAQKLFGPSILRVTELDSNDEDLLLSALNAKTGDTALVLILRWLNIYAATSIEYQRSLARNIYMAAGGPMPRLNQYHGVKPYNRILTLASLNTPIIIYHLLTTMFVRNVAEQEVYRRLLFHYKAPFPPSFYSPLAHVIRCLLHPMGGIHSADLALELLGPNYYFKFHPIHYTVALELIGNSSSAPFLVSLQRFPQTDTSGLTSNPSQHHTYYPLIGLILSILGNERISLSYDLLKKPVNPAAISYRTRKSDILQMILSLPRTKVHESVRYVSQFVFVLSTVILALTVLFLYFSLLRGNRPNQMRSRHIGWVPPAGRTWIHAVIAGLRKMFDIPRYSGRLRLTGCHIMISKTCHLVYCIALTLRCLCTWYYFLETIYLTPNSNRAASLPAVVMLTTRPLWYIPLFNFIIHTTLIRLLSTGQKRWLRWFLFGFDSSILSGATGKDPKKWSVLVNQLKWKPVGERLRMASLRKGTRRSTGFRQQEDLVQKHVHRTWKEQGEVHKWCKNFLLRCKKLNWVLSWPTFPMVTGEVESKTSETTLGPKESILIPSGSFPPSSREALRTTQTHSQELGQSNGVPSVGSLSAASVPFHGEFRALSHPRTSESSRQPPASEDKTEESPEKELEELLEFDEKLIKANTLIPFDTSSACDQDLDHLQKRRAWLQVNESVMYQDFILRMCFGQFGVSIGHFRDVFIMTTTCFLIFQFPFWRFFERLKAFNFDVYFSNAKFVSYTTRPQLTLIREIAMLVSCWTQLFHFFTPLLCAIRFAAVYHKISQVILDGFPLKDHLLSHYPKEEKDSCLASTDDDKHKYRWNHTVMLSKGNYRKGLSDFPGCPGPVINGRGLGEKARTNRCLSTRTRNNDAEFSPHDTMRKQEFPLYKLQAYMDVRQTIYAQMGYAFKPLHMTIYPMLLCAVFRIACFYVELQQAVGARHFLIDQASRLAGFQCLVIIIFINWFICVAAKANELAIRGHEIIEELYREFEGMTNTPYMRMLAQTRIHFSKTEFRMTLIGIKLGIGHAMVVLIGCVMFTTVTVSKILNGKE